MAKEYTRMKKVFCDFCKTEIPESTPTVHREITINDQPICVEVKLTQPDKRRFSLDVCTACVFISVAAAERQKQAERTAATE